MTKDTFTTYQKDRSLQHILSEKLRQPSCFSKCFCRTSTGTTANHPTTNGGMQIGSSVGMCVLCTLHAHFCMFGANLYAQSVINKISALELGRKLI